ncbi:hypothetical protein E2P81_ATG08533 [Venturia nashicola]|uniref:Uncharacterized protein n=1 Tax=Venturia nashicola TaxID=86259 RepID=A0A4Z1NGK3_9PEZI|nr:hypothetical protein E6O75_ATG08729 [Venturia nashicola]TLD20869.1 hypothetical protein E2P81_ATG08533 [Venturia nashicola]
MTVCATIQLNVAETDEKDVPLSIMSNTSRRDNISAPRDNSSRSPSLLCVEGTTLDFVEVNLASCTSQALWT